MAQLATSISHPTTAALLTPWGRGAVAVVQVRGPLAMSVVQALFVPASARRFANPQVNAVYFGHWRQVGGEEVLISIRSLDSQDALVEIHGHGGMAAPQAILNDLANAGCQIGDWPTALRAANADPIAAAATIALANAPTLRTAAILLDQARGTLGTTLHEIEADSISPELARHKLLRLAELIPVGEHLTEPWRVVLAGKPNVGKSSLMNRLVGYDRSIVFDQPGTTRDVLEAVTAFDGWPIRLIDCAGLNATADPIEAEGVLRAQHELRNADLVLVVIDAQRSITAEMRDILQRQPNSLLVANKSDLIADQTQIEKNLPSNRPVVFTSAISGAGIDELIRHIVATLIPAPPQPGEAVPFAVEQATWIQSRLLA